MYIDTKERGFIYEPLDPISKPFYDLLVRYQTSLDGSRLYDDLIDVYINQEMDYKEDVMKQFEVDNPMSDNVNPIVEGETVGECAGCGEEIYLGEDIYDLGVDVLHSKSECCQDYISHVSVCRVAGE